MELVQSRKQELSQAALYTMIYLREQAQGLMQAGKLAVLCIAVASAAPGVGARVL